MTTLSLETESVKPRRDIFYLYAARAARGFADGFAVIILPAYLSEIGYSPFQIGLVAAAALLGSAGMTLAVGFLARHHDLRRLLLISALAMALTGLALPSFEAFAFVLLIVFLGTMNPSTGDIGMFVPLEHAMLAHGAADQDRTRIFAHYSLIAAIATAVGALAAATPDGLILLGVDKIGALKAMFYFYAGLGLVSIGLYQRLPRTETHDTAPRATALGPSKGIVYRLAALFSLDAFAGGFAVQSLVALWLFERFDLSLA